MNHSVGPTSTRPISRRRFLHSAAAGALALSGCGETKQQTLRVFVYAGGHETTMREVFVPAFEKQTGARVILDTGWWDAIAKLKASPKDRPAFDLMVTDATQGYPAAREGLFQTINVKALKHLDQIAPAVLDNWIVQKGYGITFPDSVMTLAYNKDMVPNAPMRWDDLLRDDLRGKIGLYNSFYMSLYTFACMKAARENKAGKAAEMVENDLDGVLQFAKDHRDRVKFWWPTSNEMILGLDHKDCAAGNMHSPEMLQALRESPNLGAIIPEADRAFVQLFWAIPEGTPNKELAERALDALFSPEMQLGFTRHGSATALLSVAKQRASEDPLWKQIYPHTEDQLRSLRYYPYDAYFRHWDDISTVWQREILRKA